MLVRALDRAHDARQTGGVRERGDELLAVTSPDAGGTALTRRGAQRRGRRADIGVQPRQHGLPPAHARLDRLAQRVGALPRPGGQREHRDVVEAACRQHPFEILAGAIDLVAEQVRLVEHDQHRRRVPGHGTQIAVVQRRVRVLLRVHHPHEQVDDPDEAVDLFAVGRLDRVEVREVEQDQARGRTRVEGVPTADPEPVQQRGRHRFAHRGGRARRRRSAHAGA